MSLVYHALPDIKRIHVYLNGEPYQPATSIIVHPRRIRNYEVFLKDLTEKLRPSYGAVRNVYTPVNGSRVKDLEDLENHQKYVAAGREAFKKYQYINIEQMQAKRKIAKTPGPKPVTEANKSRNFRRRPYNWEPLTIFVFRNGDDVSPAKKVAFVRSDLEDWDKLLLKVSDKLNEKGFVRKLYSLSGDWIRNADGIKNGHHYVAVGSNDQFKNVLYGKLIDRLPKEFLNSVGTQLRQQQQQTSNPTSKFSVPSKKTTTGTAVKLPTFIKKPKLVKKDDFNAKKDLGAIKKAPKTGDKENKSVSISTRSKVEYIKKPANYVGKGHPEVVKHQAAKKKVLPSVKSIKPVENNPQDTEKKKKAALHKTNQKLIKDGKSPDSEDSAYISENEERRRKKLAFESPYKAPHQQVYFAPTKKIRPKKVKVVNYDEDSGGIYRAKSQHKEAKNAKEVHELRHIPIELPIDEVEATEIGDELLMRHEEETEDDSKESSEDEIHRRKNLSKEYSSEKEDVSSPDSANVHHSPQHKHHSGHGHHNEPVRHSGHGHRNEPVRHSGHEHHNEHGHHNEHEQDHTHNSTYPISYTREVQPSARTA